MIEASTYIIHLFVVGVEGIDLGCQVVDLSCCLENGHWCGELLTLKDVHVALYEQDVRYLKVSESLDVHLHDRLGCWSETYVRAPTELFSTSKQQYMCM